MSIHEEKQYLKELKFTHEKQIQTGKIYRASNTLKLIQDCEKRIESLEKIKSNKTILSNDCVIWKPLKGFEKTHTISSLGKIKRKAYYSTNSLGAKRLMPEREVALFVNSNILKVNVAVNSKSRILTVVNLVYETFIGDIPANFTARNKDNNIHNCDMSNIYLSKFMGNRNRKKRIKNIA